MRRVLFLGIWLLTGILSPLSLTAQARVEEAAHVDAPVVTTNAFTQMGDALLAHTGETLAQATQTTLATRTTYTLAAEHGDGITHLARKALHEYLVDINRANEYERAQRIFVEDYLQNRIGTYWLSVGQVETFTVDQIQAALGEVAKVNTGLLEANLAKYVARVDWQKYETLTFGRSKEVADSEIKQNPGDSATTDNDEGSTDSDAAQTQNTNSNTTRTIVYVIIVLIILAIAGYLLFRGQQDGETPGLDALKKNDRDALKKPDGTAGSSTDYTKSDNSSGPKGTSEK